MSCFCCKCDLVYCKFCRDCDCEKSVCQQAFYPLLSNPLSNDWLNNPRNLVGDNLALKMYVPQYDDFGDPLTVEPEVNLGYDETEQFPETD